MSRFLPQWYNSDESYKTPYALTPDESQWYGEEHSESKARAIETCRAWNNTDGCYRTGRVVELDDDGRPVSVVWMSAWEAPVDKVLADAIAATGGAGLPGETVKVQVWMSRESGPPDHWDWQGMFDRWLAKTQCLSDSNSWDLGYGRLVDSNGKMNLWSIKLDLWPTGEVKPPSMWKNWYNLFGKDEDHAHEVEIMRIYETGPREFPAGVETAECYHCGKIHLASTSWQAYVDATDEYEKFDRCFCIDQLTGTDAWRMTPDGMEIDDEPACEVERDRNRLTAA